MAEIIKLAVIGMSDGNGHPYSWSAIFNGYNKKFMEECPFPVIPQYLGEEKWPDASIKSAEVKYIWTQDKLLSEHIAKASNIPNIAIDLDDLLKSDIDGVLLARDDGENHVKMSLPFIKAGKRIFIDKPLAITLEDAKLIFSSQQYQSQVFTCSSLRYATELHLNDNEKTELGSIVKIEGNISKDWQKYGIHILEPVIANSPSRGRLLNVKASRYNGVQSTIVEWEHLILQVNNHGNKIVPITLSYFNSDGNSVDKEFNDTFKAFKTSLQVFIESFQNIKIISDKEVLEIIEIIEKGSI
jgi:hypothetical protein